MSYEDLNDHPVARHAAGEAYDHPSDHAWERYVRDAERRLGTRLARCAESEDGCSLDSAHDAWRAGVSAADYAAGDRTASVWAKPRRVA